MADPRIEYLGNIDSSRLLNREGEVELARQIERAHLDLLDLFVSCDLPLESVVEDPEFHEILEKARAVERRTGRLRLNGPETNRLLGRFRGLILEPQEAALKLVRSKPFERLPARQRLEIRSRVVDANRKIESAQALFVESNLRLVVSIARRFRAGNVPFIDLVQEGNMGLLRAVGKFDYRRGYRLSTYATWWIRQSIARAVADKGRAIRIPVHMIETKHIVERTRHAMMQENGYEPTPEEIAARAEVPLRKVTRALDVCQEPLSLDAPARDGEDFLIGDQISDDRTVSPVDAMDDRQVALRIANLLKALSPREQQVMRLRFGIGEKAEDTLENVGKRFGVTRERVRQIESKALMRMRRMIEAEGPRGELKN